MFQAGLRRYLLSASLLVIMCLCVASAVAQQDAKPSSDQASPSSPPSQAGQAADPLKRPISEKQKKRMPKP